MTDVADPALQRLIEQVRAARSDGTSLDIRGGGTKAWYGEAPQGAPLDVTGLRGISSYEPTELVVTVRAGTLLLTTSMPGDSTTSETGAKSLTES